MCLLKGRWELEQGEARRLGSGDREIVGGYREEIHEWD